MRNLKVTEETKDLIDKLVKQHKLMQKDLLFNMVNFFYQTGTDPKTNITPSPGEEIKKLKDTLISFMRKQESDFIKPTFGKMQSLMEMFVHYMENEAPKNESKKELATETKKPLIVEQMRAKKEGDNSDEIAVLQNDLDKKTEELRLMKRYFLEICDSVEKKNTGMQKKNIVTLDEAKFQDSYSWIKNFQI